MRKEDIEKIIKIISEFFYLNLYSRLYIRNDIEISNTQNIFYSISNSILKIHINSENLACEIDKKGVEKPIYSFISVNRDFVEDEIYTELEDLMKFCHFSSISIFLNNEELPILSYKIQIYKNRKKIYEVFFKLFHKIWWGSLRNLPTFKENEIPLYAYEKDISILSYEGLADPNEWIVGNNISIIVKFSDTSFSTIEKDLQIMKIISKGLLTIHLEYQIDSSYSDVRNDINDYMKNNIQNIISNNKNIKANQLKIDFHMHP